MQVIPSDILTQFEAVLKKRAVPGEIRISGLGQDHRQSGGGDQDTALFPENRYDCSY